MFAVSVFNWWLVPYLTLTQALPPTCLPVLSAQILLTADHDKIPARPASTILS